MDSGSVSDGRDESLVLYERARTEMDADNYHAAIELFEKSNRLQPNYKTCLLLGDCYAHLNRFQDAIIPLAAATTLNRQGIAPTLLAEVFLALDEAGRASDCITIALERQPHYKKAQQLKPIIDEAYDRHMGRFDVDDTSNETP